MDMPFFGPLPISDLTTGEVWWLCKNIKINTEVTHEIITWSVLKTLGIWVKWQAEE